MNTTEKTILNQEFDNKELSPRQKDVAILLVQGMTAKEMGNKLFITEKCIKFHLTDIYKKFEIPSGPKLMRHCHLKVMSESI